MFRVTVTTLVALTIMGTLVYLLTGGTLTRPRVPLYLYLPDATGLAKGSPVRVDGVQVGKVTAVGLSGSTEPNRVVRVTMAVDRDRLLSITEDSTGQTSSDTLVGDKFILITTGRGPGRVQPGAEIAYKASPDLTKSLDLSQFRAQLQQMDQALTEIEQGRSPVGKFILGDRFYRDLHRRVMELRGSMRAASATTGMLGRELYTTARYDQILDPVRKLDESLAQIQSGQGPAGAMLRDTGQYDGMRASVAALRQSIHQIGLGEWMRTDTAYEVWHQSVRGWIRSVDEFNTLPLLTNTAVYDNLNGAARQLQVTLREFHENPKKFLRLVF
jgi:phospholipid/cholesterol/gamma-HCH transport system substrate-binding protein